MKKFLIVIFAIVLVISLASCTSKTPAPAPAEEPAPAAASEPAAAPADTGETIKLAYISKMLSHPWFTSEEVGMNACAAEFGFDFFAIDADLSDEACDAAVDNALAQQINGLAITITNQGNGPSVAMKCADRGVALVCVDDDIDDENGNPVPFVGAPVRDLGFLGGEKLAQMANERDFFAEGNVVKVMQLDAPAVTVLKPRLEGYKDALMKNTPLKEEDFIIGETTAAMLEDSLPVAQAVIQANPQVTHWIVTGVNDDTAIAPLKAIEENGKVPRENTLICGLGGYSMSVEEFKKGNDSYICLVLDPYGHGYNAMRVLYEYLANGTPLPAQTLVNGFVVTIDDWDQYIDESTL
jgi:L-arabinose transport system substrate-binding protein